MDFVSPKSWGARIDYDTWTDRQYIKDAVAIHWGGTPQPTYANGVNAEKAILQAWERYHIDSRGWRGIAYGYAVGASGTVYRLRGKNSYGAHTGDKDGDGISNNKEIVPVVLIMGEGGTMTQAMKDSVVALVQWLVSKNWTANSLKVYGHRDLQTTSCPGDEAYQWLKNTNFFPAPAPPSTGTPDPRYVLRVQYDEYLRQAHTQFQKNIAAIQDLKMKVAELEAFKRKVQDL